MNFEDKILKVRQFDEEILINLKEICEILLVYKNQPMYVDEVYNGHISYINIKNNNVVLNVTYNICETDNGDSFETMTFIIPLKYFNMTKEELMEEKLILEKAREEQNRQRIIGMYKKKLEEIENMKDQLNVLKAEIVSTQEEAEELKRLSERK